MGIPLIYCDTQVAVTGEDVIVSTRNLTSSGVWTFVNAEVGSEINIIGGGLTETFLKFQCLIPLNPLFIRYDRPQNSILNGSTWENPTNGLAYDWVGGTNQTNIVAGDGWNFDGNSQRVTRANTTDKTYISQGNIGLSDDLNYGFQIEYRSTSPIEVHIGSKGYNFPPTNEGPPFNIYPITHEGGDFTFVVGNATGVQWIFSDGSTDTDNVVYKSLPSGTSYLIVDDFVGVTMSSLNNTFIINGNLSDIPFGVDDVEFRNTKMTGNIGVLDHIGSKIAITNTPTVSGNVSAVYNIPTHIDLSHTGVVGNVGVLENVTDYLNLSNTVVHGYIDNFTALTKHLDLSYTSISGDIVAVSGVADYIDLSYPSLSTDIYGDIADLSGTSVVKLNGTNVTGIIPLKTAGIYWSLDNTSLSQGEIGQCLINLASWAVSSDTRNGYFRCKDGMPPVIDSNLVTWYWSVYGAGGSWVPANGYEMWATIETLLDMGWTIEVNYERDETWIWSPYVWHSYYKEVCHFNIYSLEWDCEDVKYFY